ncbi:MAG: hypothetical protein JWQ30_305 [Sediminibacterium sp.]|nr:hypothetical protein [Sediminibacterium sp.]
MEISFYLDDILYNGNAAPLEKENETHFVISLVGVPLFTICPCPDYGWKTSDPISRDFVRAAGNEIEKSDDVPEEIEVAPGRYYSATFTGGDKPKIENGEIINEPEDVQEQSVR